MSITHTVAEHGIKIRHNEGNIEQLWTKYDRIMWLLVLTLMSSLGTLLKLTFFS